MKTRVISVAALAFLVLSFVLGWRYYHIREKNEFIQNNINSAFSSHLSALFTDLFNEDIANMENDAIVSLNTNAQLCTTFLNFSSYSENDSFVNIVHALVKMAPPNNEYEIITNRELIDSIGYLILHISYPDFKDLSGRVWTNLSKQLQPI